MIMSCKDALIEAGMAEGDVKFELFTSAGASKPKAKVVETSNANTVPMQVVLDGVTTSIELDKDKNMLDAALDAGLDAPYSCLGGVCCTCRAKLVEGKASMNVNYALEPEKWSEGMCWLARPTWMARGRWCWTLTNSDALKTRRALWKRPARNKKGCPRAALFHD